MSATTTAAATGVLAVAAAAGLAVAWALAGPRPIARRPPPARPSTAPGPPAGRSAAALATDPRVAAGGAAVALVVAGPVAAASTWVAWRVAVAAGRRRRADRRQAAVVDELPDVVDLLRLGIGAGLSLPQVVPVVAGPATTGVRAALLAAHRAAGAGRALADALDTALGSLGEGTEGLAHVLADHLRYGTPLDPELRRLALEVRAHRRHRAEQAARRVPVRLLLPLVTCVLPAFGLLTVVPLLAGSLQDLLV